MSIVHNPFISTEVWIYIRSCFGNGLCFLIFHGFLILCSRFSQSSTYFVIINIFSYKFIKVFMQELCQKHLNFCTSLDSFPHSSFANTKKTWCYITLSHDSFEHRTFALKFTSGCKFAINWYCIRTRHHYISIFWINQYWSCLIMFLDPGIQEQRSCISFSK